ncbi:MAG: 30S ribosomal protein S16 [Chloroflexi bacterium]|nr:30S ribosomal protein S16 [Chloroflexota bacterium]
MTRVGATKRPAYRVIAIDKRRSRDGRALEILGYYDPLTEPATVKLETEKINAWIGKGAQPSETVAKLMRQAEREAQAPTTEKPKRATRPSKAKSSAKAKAKAAAADADATTDAPAAPAEEATPADEAATGGEAAPAGASAAPAADAAADEAAPTDADAGAEPVGDEKADA